MSRSPFNNQAGQLNSGEDYKGAWNASTNTPTLANGIGVNGDNYLVSVDGTQNLGSGAIAFTAGDTVIYNGTIWQKIEGGVSYVPVNKAGDTMTGSLQYLQSVNAQTGTTYTLAADDYAKLITINNASPITITLPQQSTVPTTTGFHCEVLNLGVGRITYVKEGAETIDGNTTQDQYVRVKIGRPTTTKWSIAYGTALKPSQIEAARVPSVPVAGTTYVLVAKAKDPFTISGFVQQATSLATAGTYTININGVAVTGLSAVANTTAITETAATALNSVSAGDQVTIVLTGIVTPVGWVGSLSIVQTF